MATARKIIPGLVAALLPPLLLACYLLLFRRQREFYDGVAILGPVLLGLIALNQYRMRWFFRIPISLAYIAGMTALLFVSALGYVCAAYHSCL